VSEQQNWRQTLVRRLTRLAKPEDIDRAALAHLRRGLGRPVAETLSRVGWLFDGVPEGNPNDAINDLDAAVLVAGLFAWMKGLCLQCDNVDFGRAFGSGLKREQKLTREKRFTDLLDADPDDLPDKLRQAITLIQGQSLDWTTLILHLTRWDDADKWVQKRWARGYWYTDATDDQSEADDE
jgi:CRISPR type I-E-associated protein CasB/Cse2